MTASYCVVGGGISGLPRHTDCGGRSATTRRSPCCDPADRLGGVLRTEQLGGQPVDVGAEAFVARRPEVPALLAELGMAGKQIATSGARPLIYSGGRLHPLPVDTVNGIPSQPARLAGLVDDATSAGWRDEPRGRSPGARARTRASPTWWATASASRW